MKRKFIEKKRKEAEEAKLKTPTCNREGKRDDCGWGGINQKQCEAENCCWDNSKKGVAWCFQKSIAADVEVGTVFQDSTGFSRLVLCAIIVAACGFLGYYFGK